MRSDDGAVRDGHGSSPSRSVRTGIWCPEISPRLIDVADAIGTIHPDEPDAITRIDPSRVSDVVPIELAFSSNIHARSGPLAGLGRFGRYVLLVRDWPPRTPRAATGDT